MRWGFRQNMIKFIKSNWYDVQSSKGLSESIIGKGNLPIFILIIKSYEIWKMIRDTYNRWFVILI